MVPLLKALSKRCYLMSEPHLSGFRLIIGFERLTDVQAAHTAVSNVSPAGGVGQIQTEAASVEDSQSMSDQDQRSAISPSLPHPEEARLKSEGKTDG